MCPEDHATAGPSSRESALRNVGLLVERNRRDPVLDRARLPQRPIASVGIIGAGIMGTAIAAVHVRHNIPVQITDTDPAMLDGVLDKIATELTDEAPFGKARELVARLVRPTADEMTVARCGLVIESVIEAVSAKRELYARIQPQLTDGAILTSNTSTIPIGQLADGLSDPARFCGLHFFHPVPRRPLTEIIRGHRTSDQTIASVAAHAKAIDKMPIVVDDGPGFLVNRLLLPYLGEALELLLEGVEIQVIEHAATEFGMAKGPLTLLDEIGLDTTLQSGIVLQEAFPERIVRSPLLVAMIKAGRLGRKSGAGFFSYADEADRIGAGVGDPEVGRIIAPWAGPSHKHSTRSIVARLLLPMVLEATRILEEHKVRDPRDIDLGAIFGLGFPASRGGLLWWADTLGAARIIDMLQPLKRLGPRTRPTSILLELASTNGRFYNSDSVGRQN